MPNALSKVAKDYRRAAIDRHDDALVLNAACRFNGAIYLAGYAVECTLKVLVLSMLPSHAQAAFADETFRGSDGHDFELLRTLYLTNGGARFPLVINKHFLLVRDWSTDLRYDPKKSDNRVSERFMAAVEDIIDWANGRL